MISNINAFYNGGRNLKKILGKNPLTKLHKLLKKGKYNKFQEGDYIECNKTINLPKMVIDGTIYKNLELKPNKLRIVGINFLNCHEDKNVKVPNILFDFEDINFLAPYNENSTNKGGPFNSPLMKYINSPEFLSAFCEYLEIDEELLYSVYRYYDSGYTDELSCICKETKLFFPKAEEVYGCSDIAAISYKNNVAIWPLYNIIPSTTIKEYDNKRTWWWLNSSFKFSDYEFCYVCYNGGGGHGKSYYNDGVSLSFCIK